MFIKEFGLAPLALVLALGACASLTPSQWSADVAKGQQAAAALEAAGNVYMTVNKTAAATVAAVNAAETKLNSDLAALAASPAPVSVDAVTADARAVVAALPPGARQSEATALLTALQVLEVVAGV